MSKLIVIYFKLYKNFYYKILFFLVDLNFLSPLNRTSDSDFSGSEAANGSHRTQNEMQRIAKLRLSAISLIGLIAKV